MTEPTTTPPVEPDIKPRKKRVKKNKTAAAPAPNSDLIKIIPREKDRVDATIVENFLRARNMKRSQLAREVGIDQATLSYWVNHNSVPRSFAQKLDAMMSYNPNRVPALIPPSGTRISLRRHGDQKARPLLKKGVDPEQTIRTLLRDYTESIGINFDVLTEKD